MAPTCRVPGFPELNYRCEREQVLNDVQNKIRARDARRAGHRPPTRIKFHPPSLLDMLRDEFEEANFFDYHGDPSFWKGIPLTHSVVLTALEEFERWNTPRKRHETDSVGRRILQKYWKEAVGVTVTDRQVRGHIWQNNHPWSAVFVSYVMYAAGAGSRFQYAQNHVEYIHWAIQNRVKKLNVPFKGYRTSEVKPAPGDIVGKSRSHSGATYDKLKNSDAFRETHCDIVTEIQGGHIVTIGGNVSDSVSKTNVPLDKKGHIHHADYFVVIKVDDPGSSIPTPLDQ